MEKYIKNLNKNYNFSKNGFNVILPKITCSDISICFVDIDGERDNYCMLDNSTIFYYIISGSGEFEIDDDKVPVKTDDLIEISPNKRYSYKGNLKMLEIMSNSFDEGEVHETSK